MVLIPATPPDPLYVATVALTTGLFTGAVATITTAITLVERDRIKDFFEEKGRNVG